MDTVQPVGKSILKKTDKNGKISLSTNKAKPGNGQTDINIAIRKELGLVTNRKKITTVRSPKVQNIKQIRNARINIRKNNINDVVTYNRPLEMDAGNV